MTEWWDRFADFLATDPRDIGCDEAVEIVHVYVDLLAQGIHAEDRFPGMAAHIASCGPCAEDVEGLLSAVVEMDRSPNVLPSAQ